MTEGLLLPSGEPFATGVSSYLDARPEHREPLPRIYLEFQPGGADRSFVALLDTGGHYCILQPDVAAQVEDHLTDRLTPAGLHTAHGTIRGELYRHRITLLAQRGESLEIDATIFVSSDWRGPNILGYTGALDRIRFAIDPGGNWAYFGPLV